MMRKNNAFVAKIVNTRLTKSFMAIFAPAESLPSPATLPQPYGQMFFAKKDAPILVNYCPHSPMYDLPPHIGGRHLVLYFQHPQKYSAVMY